MWGNKLFSTTPTYYLPYYTSLSMGPRFRKAARQTVWEKFQFLKCVSSNIPPCCRGLLLRIPQARDQRTRLLHRNTMKALRDIALLQNSPNEQAQTAACLVRLTCNSTLSSSPPLRVDSYGNIAQGQEALLDEPGLPRALVKLLSHSTPDVRQNAARCIANVATTSQSFC